MFFGIKKKIIKEFLLNSHENLKPREVSQILGVSVDWVRKIKVLIREENRTFEVNSISSLIKYIIKYLNGDRLLDDN